MDALVRLLARFVVVPLGIIAAVIAAITVAAAANWTEFIAIVSAPVIDLASMLTFLALLFIQSLSVSFMLLPGAIGIVLSEAFAIRAWWFHAPLGGLSIWIGWSSMGFDLQSTLYDDPKVVVAAGIAAGFAYWAVAGWNAGFWKPVFGSSAPAHRASPLETAGAGAAPGEKVL